MPDEAKYAPREKLRWAHLHDVSGTYPEGEPEWVHGEAIEPKFKLGSPVVLPNEGGDWIVHRMGYTLLGNLYRLISYSADHTDGADVLWIDYTEAELLTRNTLPT